MFHERNRYNALQRYRTPDDPVVIAAKRALDLARTEQAIKDAVEQAPPLDDLTLARLRALIPVPADTELAEAGAGDAA